MSERDAVLVFIKVHREGAAEAVRLDSARVIGLSYEDTDTKADKFTLTLDNYDLRHFNDPLVRDGDLLDVTWGYPGLMSPTRECVIKKITGGAQLKVEAHGKASLLHSDRKTRIFRGMKRSDIARQIAVEVGFELERQDIEDTSERIAQVNQAGMTDAALLANLAKREGFAFYIDHLGFHFHSRRLGQAPRRKFTWFVDQRGEMLSFPNVETDITAKPGAVTVKGRDALTKKPIEARGDNSTTAGRPGLAPVLKVIDRRDGQATLQQRSASEIVAPTTETSQASAERAAKGAYKGVQTTAVKLSWSNIGDPTTEAKTVVELAGIGSLISGNYYIESVTHKVLPGPYTMDVKARRDGTSNAASTSNVATSKGKTNDAAAPSGGAGDDLEPIEVVDQRTGERRVQYRPRGSSRGDGT